MRALQIHPEIAEALAEAQPVVALESAVITAGLPCTPLGDGPNFDAPEWDATAPVNMEIARLMQRRVREASAIPAVIAVIDGKLHIGLDDALLERLARDETAGKCSTTTLAAAIASGRCAGTTVSATLRACALVGSNSAGGTGTPIRVFATGGIGGVHRGWTQSPDISADLLQLASTPTCVVCAGAKSILDIPATLEALQSLSVPVLGYRTDIFPQFFSRGNPSQRVNEQCETVEHAARICCTHWNELGLKSGVLLANPLPESQALDDEAIESVTVDVEREANEAGVSGDERTPFLLRRLAERTGGRSLQANLALLANNAALAGELAAAICADR